MRKVRFGIIGTNFITDWILEAAREELRFEATAVCSRSRETGQAFALKHGIPHLFTSPEEMAASSLIDAVYIAVPNSTCGFEYSFHATRETRPLRKAPGF